MEKVILDFGAYVRHAKAVWGYEKVVLAGWSGGGSLLYQAEAERVLSENNFARLRKMTLDSWSGGEPDPAEAAAYVEAWSELGALTGASTIIGPRR